MLLILVLIKGVSTQYNGWESLAYDTTPMHLKYKVSIYNVNHSSGAI